ncbi:hypothetical protein [Sorangium sp. So ce117]|uniref:hypothetical protein n=1 Tax=Sorangium sp. So ce117 TaxID=3133277 RepID=UPI003F5F2AE8
MIGIIGVDSSASRLCCTRMISSCNAARSRSRVLAFSRADISSASRVLGERLRRRGSERRGPPAPGPPLRHGAAMGDSPAGCRNSRRKRALTAWRAVSAPCGQRAPCSSFDEERLNSEDVALVIVQFVLRAAVIHSSILG